MVVVNNPYLKEAKREDKIPSVVTGGSTHSPYFENQNNANNNHQINDDKDNHNNKNDHDQRSVERDDKGKPVDIANTRGGLLLRSEQDYRDGRYTTGVDDGEEKKNIWVNKSVYREVVINRHQPTERAPSSTSSSSAPQAQGHIQSRDTEKVADKTLQSRLSNEDRRHDNRSQQTQTLGNLYRPTTSPEQIRKNVNRNKTIHTGKIRETSREYQPRNHLYGSYSGRVSVYERDDKNNVADLPSVTPEKDDVVVPATAATVAASSPGQGHGTGIGNWNTISQGANPAVAAMSFAVPPPSNQGRPTVTTNNSAMMQTPPPMTPSQQPVPVPVPVPAPQPQAVQNQQIERVTASGRKPMKNPYLQKPKRFRPRNKFRKQSKIEDSGWTVTTRPKPPPTRSPYFSPPCQSSATANQGAPVEAIISPNNSNNNNNGQKSSHSSAPSRQSTISSFYGCNKEDKNEMSQREQQELQEQQQHERQESTTATLSISKPNKSPNPYPDHRIPQPQNYHHFDAHQQEPAAMVTPMTPMTPMTASQPYQTYQSPQPHQANNPPDPPHHRHYPHTTMPVAGAKRKLSLENEPNNYKNQNTEDDNDNKDANKHNNNNNNNETEKHMTTDVYYYDNPFHSFLHQDEDPTDF